MNGHADSYLVLIVNRNSLSICFLDQFFHQLLVGSISRRSAALQLLGHRSFAACSALHRQPTTAPPRLLLALITRRASPRTAVSEQHHEHEDETGKALPPLSLLAPRSSPSSLLEYIYLSLACVFVFALRETCHAIARMTRW